MFLPKWFVLTELEASPSFEDGQGGEPPANKPVVIGEGGESGDIVSGKSVVFATLEVVLCVLVRHLPALNPSLPAAGFHPPTRHMRLTEETCRLVSSALNVMTELPPLCSPAGKGLLCVNHNHKPLRRESLIVSM